MKILKDKIVVYDSDCPLCCRLRQYALHLGILAEDDCLSLYALPAHYGAAVDTDRFRNEMALVDLQGGRTLYGSDGLLQVFATRFPLLEPLVAVPSLRSLCRAAYKIVAPNRYVLSTPRNNGIACSCSEVGSRSDRMRYIVAGIAVSLVITLLFVFAMRIVFPEVAWVSAVVAIAAGWVVYMLIAAAILGSGFIEFTAHMTSVMWRGTVILLPVVFLSIVTSSATALLLLAGLCVAVSFGYMLHQHERRIKILQLRPFWTALWACLLWSSAFAVLYILEVL